MPVVVKPGKRLITKAPLEFIRKMAGGHGRSTPIADLNVTPLVDMLTMLVIFLLMTFSASGEILTSTKDIVLPKAYNAVALEMAPIIQVSAKSIAFIGQHVMDTADVTEAKYADWKLTPLHERLERNREQWKAYNQGKPFDGQIIIQSDNAVPFSVIKMIMLTCAQADYTGMNFAVTKSGRADSAVGH